MQALELIYPDDWHCHLRDGKALEFTVPMVASHFKRAIVMPNLASPLDENNAIEAYYQRIINHRPSHSDFEPLMILYLTNSTTPKIIKAAADNPHVLGSKLYPAGVTTHSEAGVFSIERLYPVFEAMSLHKMKLLIHGEVSDPHVDIFDKEAVFIEQYLQPIVHNFPDLKIIFEHITTQEAVYFVQEGPQTLAATITPQHLLYNRNALFTKGLRPHHYCLPVLKRKKHQESLILAATSGNPKFFIGTDSAPHTKSKKESSCGCAGIFNHHAAIAIYAQIFEQAGALDKLEGFTSIFGPRFYGLPCNQQKIRLEKKPWQVASQLSYENDLLVPFLAGETLEWQTVS